MRHRPFTASLLLCGVAAFVGCQSSTQPQTPPSFKGFADPGAMYLHFKPESKQNRVRGVDDAYIAWLHWCDDVAHQENVFIALAIWTDFASEGFSANGAVPRTEGEVGQFDYRIGDKPELRVTCRTADGKTGTVEVNGEKFDLSKGWLILVKTQGDTVRTKQIQRAGVRLTPKHMGGFQEYEKVQADPEIAAFFGKGK